MDQKQPDPRGTQPLGAFPKLRDDNLVALREILEGLPQIQQSLDENLRKLRDFYLTAMDTDSIEKQGATPLASMMKRIDGIKTTDELVAVVARLRVDGVHAMFDFWVDQDEKHSEQYAAHMGQGGMGLPDRDYYVGKSEDSNRVRKLYRKHVAKMFELLGDSEKKATAEVNTVLRIETRLAEASRTPVQLRDVEALYNKKTASELADLAPTVDWKLYLTTLDVPPQKELIVCEPEFFQRVDQLVRSEKSQDWQTYLRWHLVHSMAPYLSSSFEKENFRFYEHELRGVKEMQPRWKRVVTTIDAQMGEALGKLYVEKHFPIAAKERMDQMVKNIMAAYRERIASRDWMSAKTKKFALAKLDALMPKIGYPSKWRDYSTLEVRTDSYAQNVLRAEAFESRYRFSKLGKPVDRTEWQMTTPTVNAYYNPTMNEIVFPAGILQPPFFDLKADDAVNYGGIGAVIGHEITHGFDDQGSRSDALGNLVNWWTKEDRERFNAKTDKLVQQYDACTVLGGLHVNGKLTLGENIADLGGVTISYAAYQKSLHGNETPKIDGLTGPQRFFIGFARVWRGSTRDDEQRLRIRIDPHSPFQFRTLVPLSNVTAFYDAFNVKPSGKWYRKPADRVEVW